MSSTLPTQNDFDKALTKMLDEERDNGWQLGFSNGILVAGFATFLASFILRLFIDNELASIINYVAISLLLGNLPLSFWQWRLAQKRLREIQSRVFQSYGWPQKQKKKSKIISWLYSKSLVGRGMIWVHKGTRRYTERKGDVKYRCPACGEVVDYETQLARFGECLCEFQKPDIETGELGPRIIHYYELLKEKVK